MTVLKSLGLHNTQATDLSPLAKITTLEWLDLDNTQVTDLSPLAEMTTLGWLYLSGTQVSDLGVLRECENLRVFVESDKRRDLLKQSLPDNATINIETHD